MISCGCSARTPVNAVNLLSSMSRFHSNNFISRPFILFVPVFQAMSTNREIIARCHCGAFSLTTTLPLSTLPQSHTYCHCESCRRRSGHLVLKPLGLGDYQPTESDLQPLASYSTCLGVNPVTTYFCRTCGSKVFIKVLSRSKTRSRWAMPLGVVADPKGLVEMKGHSWVGDTKDGGVTEMMNDGLPRYKEESG